MVKKHCRFFHSWKYGQYIHPRLAAGRYERHCLKCGRTERHLYNPDEWVRYNAQVEQREAIASGGSAVAEKWIKFSTEENEMYTYQKSENENETFWTVGYWKASGIWQPIKDFVREERAAAYVNYLNGGSGVLFGEK